MTRNLSVGTAPVDLVRALALNEGTTYTLEVVLPGPSVRLSEGPAPPTDRSYFHSLPPGAANSIRPVAGQKIYVWTARGNARLVVSDAV